MSLRLKLTLWYTFLLGVLVIGFAVVHYYVVKWAVTEEMKSQLSQKAGEFAESLTWKSSGFEVRNSFPWQQLEFNVMSDYAVMVQVVDYQGKILHQSGNLNKTQTTLEAPVSTVITTLETITETKFNGEPYYILYHPVKDGGAFLGWIQVGAFEKRITSFLSWLQNWMLYSVPFGLILSALIGYYLARKMLAPIDSILATAARIHSPQMDVRFPDYEKEAVEIQQLATTLNELLDRLRESFIRISDFTSDASHELLTPLTAMIGNIDVTLRRQRTAEEYDETLKKMRRESQRMVDTVKSLLFLARSEPPYGSLQRRTTNIGVMIQEEVDNLAPLIYSHNLTISYKTEPIEAFVNESLFRQLVQNLLTNAIKYSHAGGKIEVYTESKDRHFSVIRIVDQGIGIPKEAIGRLFDRFYRVDSSRQRSTGGSGLGLTISKRIVDLHQGTIRILSEENVGTEVIITLPCRPADENTRLRG